MSEPFLGMIAIYGFNFAPRGWAMCNGQILPIAQNTALFSLLGTTYGGNGQTTFALPNLQGRVPVHFGSGAGLAPVSLGELAGKPSITLTTQQLPGHNHGVQVPCNTEDSTTTNPSGAVPANATANVYAAAATPGAFMANVNSGLTGQNQPIDILPPFLALNFCIALEGIFPSRN